MSTGRGQWQCSVSEKVTASGLASQSVAYPPTSSGSTTITNVVYNKQNAKKTNVT